MEGQYLWEGGIPQPVGHDIDDVVDHIEVHVA